MTNFHKSTSKFQSPELKFPFRGGGGGGRGTNSYAFCHDVTLTLGRPGINKWFP